MTIEEASPFRCSFVFVLPLSVFTSQRTLSVLSRDVNVDLKEEWLVERDGSKDSFVLSSFLRMLEGRERTFDMVDKR